MSAEKISLISHYIFESYVLLSSLHDVCKICLNYLSPLIERSQQCYKHKILSNECAIFQKIRTNYVDAIHLRLSRYVNMFTSIETCHFVVFCSSFRFHCNNQDFIKYFWNNRKKRISRSIYLYISMSQNYYMNDGCLIHNLIDAILIGLEIFALKK